MSKGPFLNSTRLTAAGKILAVVLGTLACAWLVRLIVGKPVRGGWWWQILLAVVAVLSSVLAFLMQRRHWAEPLKRLRTMLTEAHQGAIPIEELNRLEGGLKPLAPILQEIFRDLRQQRAAIAELNVEIRQRVAQRTDKLERTIGSLRHQATKDVLTGLHNRRALDEMLPKLVEVSRENGQAMCVLMIDVDYFKNLNDTLGHAAGDEFLKTIGQLVRSTVRPTDFAFRCGGDELVILLPECNLQGGKALGTRLMDLTAAVGRSFKIDPSPRLSIGTVCSMEMLEASADEILAEADRRLYSIKVARKSGSKPAAPGASSLSAA